MAIFDTMRHIRPDVSTVCVGLAARYKFIDVIVSAYSAVTIFSNLKYGTWIAIVWQLCLLSFLILRLKLKLWYLIHSESCCILDEYILNKCNICILLAKWAVRLQFIGDRGGVVIRPVLRLMFPSSMPDLCISKPQLVTWYWFMEIADFFSFTCISKIRCLLVLQRLIFSVFSGCNYIF